ncbi:hypothetical protein TNCV_758641 [Trichonephila clavipes]|nr:hypothetical protein TNCV_758641 [Trichonephila clavipes]
MVWTGISTGGRTELHIILNDNLRVQRYADEILRPYVVPYNSFLLMLDNGRFHTDHHADNFHKTEATQRTERPACSADLNTMEHA